MRDDIIIAQLNTLRQNISSSPINNRRGYILYRQLKLPVNNGTGLECAAAGDHFAAVAGGIQACTEDGTVPQIIRQRKLSATVALTLV